jgi:uncharacterized protein YndB with AHSA1/START domain
MNTTSEGSPIVLERRYPATADAVWQLWTTPEGIPRWWAPEGFTVTVQRLELRPGGELDYTMTATAPAQVEFMRSAGMPLSTPSHKRFTEVDEPHLLAYRSVIDFVPDRAPYEHLTTVRFTPDGEEVVVTMEMESLHDEVWTERLVAGRANELDNLGRLLAG